MRFHPRLVVLGLSALTFAGCTSGGNSIDTPAAVRCNDATNFCLVSCDLGCGAGTCAVTEVAENQRLQFVFNQPIATGSVDGSTFSLRTQSGEAPQGDVLVDGTKLTFVPAIAIANGISTFGFRRNETYVMTVVGGASGIKSTSGSTLKGNLSCTVAASRGIIDDDNAPPQGVLVTPANLAAAPVDSAIVVRFSEVIETSPFLSPVSASTPIHYVVRQTLVQPGEDPVCIIDSEAIQLEGQPEVGVESVNGKLVTTISLRPAFPLPSLKCVEVQITGDVRDLAGRGAQDVTYRFLTAASQQRDTELVEDFAGEARMDPDVSGGVWSSGAHSAKLGGDGRHGSFNIANGVAQANNTWLWSTDNQTIPDSQTFSGQTETVTDGEFFFTDFVLPAGNTLKFEGTHPVKIHVRGRVDIRGIIDCSGKTVPNRRVRLSNTTVNSPLAGGPGGEGGPGGASGGKAGDRCLGAGPVPNNDYDGLPGGDLNLPAGHSYTGSALGTGGRGSPVQPSHATTTSLTTTHFTLNSNSFNSDIAAPGGGGGYNTAGFLGGQVGTAPVLFLGTPVNTSASFDPVPASGPSSALRYLIGGSGGGGSGSHPFCALSLLFSPTQTQLRNDAWKAGGAGAGGGGVLLLRAGRSVTIGSTGQVLAKGGSGPTIDGDDPATPFRDQMTSTNLGVCAPGGGGSGGSIVLQADRDVLVDGLLSTAGGSGGRIAGLQPTTFGAIDVRGGDGAAGFYRVEAGSSVAVNGTSNVPAFNPARNQGTLNDFDRASGARSLWRNAGFVFPPTWLRYEMVVDLGDGSPLVTYSDDPTLPGAIDPTSDPNAPVQVWFQGARVNAANQPDPTSLRSWRNFIARPGAPGLNLDSVTGFRFELQFNHELFPNAVVRRLAVVVRG